MADVPAPKPVEGWAQERRLGVFGPDLEAALERQREREAAQASAQRQKSLVAALMLLVGMVAIIVSVTAILGWAWGTGVGGMMILIMGYMLGRDDSGTNNERGQ